MQPDPAKVFFSYARLDAPWVLQLASDLRAAGIELWIDQLDIPTGERWDQQVEAALRACQRLLVVLSPASVASQNVMDEVGFALSQGKAIVPVLLQPCELPLRLHRLQHIDFTADYPGALRKLQAVLRPDAPAKGPPNVAAPTPIPAAPVPAPPPASPVSTGMPRKLALGAAAGLSVTVLAALIWGDGTNPPLPPVAVESMSQPATPNTSVTTPTEPKPVKKAKAAPTPTEPGTAAAAEPTADAVKGHWIGQAVDASGTRFQVELEIRAGCTLGQRCGWISVSHVPCKGELSLHALQGNDHEFSVDRFSPGSGSQCTPGAGEHLRPIKSGAVLYTTTYDTRIKAFLKPAP